ncbi:MAG: (deoxy)nucleoside triphosphate pyrophosphohydrolase [Desulfobacterales bacterium]|jgi:8-oxo-dGTP diphosphatase
MKKVTAAILIKDKKILIAKRKADDRQANKWEFPGGTVEHDETPEACLKREIREEFGIKVLVGRFFEKSVYHYNHGPIKLLAYRAHWESGQLRLKDHADCRWVSSEQLSEYDFAPADIPIVEKLQHRASDIWR